MKFVNWHSAYLLSAMNMCSKWTCVKTKNFCFYGSLTV